MTNEMLAVVFFLTILGITLIPVVGLLLEGIVYFWSRGRVYKGYSVKVMESLSFDCTDPFDTVKGYVGFCVILIGIVGNVIISSLIEVWGIKFFVFIIVALAAMFLPRFFLDVCHSIKFNFKTQEADLIKELQEKVKKLENKTK